jgi:hypothetical protein
MATKLDILNNARTMMADTTVQDAEEIPEQFALLESIKNTLINMKSWKFAIKRVMLSRLTLAPEFGYKYQYQLPYDFIKILKINGVMEDFEINGDKLLTDKEEMKIEYLSNNLKYEDLPPLLVKYLELKLASELCIVYERIEYIGALNNQAELCLRRAAAMDAQNERNTTAAFNYTWHNVIHTNNIGGKI